MKRLIFIISVTLLLSCKESPKFRLLDPDQTGIEFSNTITESDSFHVMTYEYIYNGAGVGIGDFNTDGLQDIVFAGNQVAPRVYINEGGFRFRDISRNLPGLDNGQWYSSVTVADVNNDRLPDIYLTSTASKDSSRCMNRLWVNEGTSNGKDPSFSEKAEEYGIAENGQSVNATFFDYDLDGDMDLYVLNNTVNERMNTSYRQKITNGSAMNNDKLYRNEGNGRFTDVTVEAGIVIEGFGLGLAVGDVNKDGYPDIYVSNDYISNDLLYINQKNGTFRNEIRNLLSYQTKSSMGNDMSDVNNDGFPDIYTLDMMPESYERIKQTINGFSYIFYVNDAKYDYEHQYLRNMLHIHNGFIDGEMLPFSEVGQMSGVYKSEWSWSPLFADYDNDGDRDLLIANGYPKDMTDKDWTRYKAEVYGFVADESHVIDMAPAVKVPNIAYENKGDLVFERKGEDWLPQLPSYSYGAAFVDLDNDGDLDYVTNNLNDKAFVYRNTTAEKHKNNANYLRIRLLGKQGNTMAIGSKIEMWYNGRYQFIEHFLTRGYASSVDPVIHFGTGEVLSIDSVKVTWPLGRTSTLVKNIAVNQTIELDESSAAQTLTVSPPDKTGRHLFELQEDVLSYQHVQKDFIDFFLSQNIIPHKFSQIGPCIAQGDLDGDGLNDLVIGSTNTLPTTAFINRNGTFTEVSLPGLTEKKVFSESDIAIADFDKDGDNDLIAVAGGYENQDENEFRHYLYRNMGGSYKAEELPVPAFSASVVRTCDFDHDGDTDIFIGSRIKKGMFPYATSSWFLRNTNGVFSADTSSGLNLGMVTDALWSDFDGDGWEDLFVAREWNSIALLKNSEGRDFIPLEVAGLNDHHGIWYAIAAGDFDKDGDQDYIAGNLGENYRHTASSEYPMSLYAVDIDNDGNIDPIMTSWWRNLEGDMKEYPVNYFDELSAQTSYFRDKFNSYTSFSNASIKDMLDEKMLERVQFKLNVNTTSSYVIWNDAGQFRFERLPALCQVSPVTRMIIRDFNNDKYPDVLLAGNDYTYDVATGYFDANKGIVMINQEGSGKFKIMSPSQSGLFLQGMVQSLQLVEGDVPFLITGLNRGRTRVYRLNPSTGF